MLATPAAHYDLLFREDCKGPKRLIQTSFFGGDVEKRDSLDKLGLVPELTVSHRSGMAIPAVQVGGRVLPDPESLAKRTGLAVRDIVRAFWPPMSGGAEIFPNEGLDLLLNQQPRNTGLIVAPTFLGLYTSATSSTTPAFGAVLATQTGVTEVPAASAYARVSTAAGDWGAIATSGAGRRTTAAQKSFPESTGSWGTVNGFFDANLVTVLGGVAFFYANFDDLQPINVNAAGYTIRVTPFWHIDG